MTGSNISEWVNLSEDQIQSSFEANWNHAATQVYACPRHKISILKLSSSPGVPH